MRCLACGSVISNSQRHCARCHCDTRPSQQALDACLLALFIDACIFVLFTSPWVWAIGLIATTVCAVIFVVRMRGRTRGDALHRRSRPAKARRGKLNLVDQARDGKQG